MKTKEFIKAAEDFGLVVKENQGWFSLVRNCGIGVNSYTLDMCKISKEDEYLMNINYPELKKISRGDRKFFIDICYEYTSTPIKEREDEKKYYLKHKWLKLGEDVGFYLQSGSDVDYFLSRIKEEIDFKTQFTLEEIAEIKCKFNTKLEDFEMIEVEDDR